jgi:hypothetical protein
MRHAVTADCILPVDPKDRRKPAIQLDKEPAIIVRETDATMRPTPQDIQLMSKHCVLSFKPQRRLELRGQDGQNETEQPNHSASLGDSITSSTRIRFSVHTGVEKQRDGGIVLRSTFARFFGLLDFRLLQQNPPNSGHPLQVRTRPEEATLRLIVRLRSHYSWKTHQRFRRSTSTDRFRSSDLGARRPPRA